MLTLKKGPGIPIVFLHGFLGSPHDWEAVCSYLPPCHCIGVNLPGHNGASELTIDLPEFHLVGYSMGARLGRKLSALSHTLLSVHPGLKTEEEKQMRMQSDLAWAKLLRELPIDQFLERWYHQPIFQSFVPDLTMRKKQNKDELAKALIEFSLAKQTYQEVEGALIGEHDEKFRALHANPVLVPDSAHAVHLENPRFVAAHIARRIFS